MSNSVAILQQIKQKTKIRSRAIRFAKDARWLVPWMLRQKFVKTRFGIESVRNVLLDWKYGGYCGGKFASPFANTGAHGTSSADYHQMRLLFCKENGIEIKPSDVLVDVGCGRGRVLNYWLSLGRNNRMYGVELDERFAREAEARLRRYPNVTVICGDAIEEMPEDATIFHLFNPFNGEIMEQFKNRLYDRFKDRDELTIVYQYCRHLHVFRNDQRWIIEPVRTKTFYNSAIIRIRREFAS